MAQNAYGSFGSVPTVDPQGAYRPQSVQASPADFGAAIGQGIQEVGNAGQKLGQEQLNFATQIAKQATEAKVNDDYANKYAPAAADLRDQFDQLRGQDKIHGYQTYIQGLQDLNQQFTSNTTSPYEKELMGSRINSHIAMEIDGAKRELVQSQKELAQDSMYSMFKANNGYAAQNYNNPQIADAMERQNHAMLDMYAVDNGHNFNDPDQNAALQAQKDNISSQMTVGRIQAALSANDVATATQIRADKGSVIPGYQQNVVDDAIHVAAQRQNGDMTLAALKTGSPIPQGVGHPPAEVQAAVAKAAQDSGLDVNTALTMLRIESMYGQNVGPNLGHHGDIGQTGLARGKPLDEQASVMMDKMKEAQGAAQNALGRAPMPWETYLTYQQGPGGGPALLKALKDDPTQNAIDALTPAYDGDRNMATRAVVKNGGNLSSSVQDFANFWQNKYAVNNRRASIEIPNLVSGTVTGNQISEALMSPHTETGDPVQPAVTPRQNLINFDAKYSDMVQRAMDIPNTEDRAYVLKRLNQERETLSVASNAYTMGIVTNAQKMAQDPKFTDVSQVPPDMASTILSDSPTTWHYLETMADYNKKKNGGMLDEDSKKFGPGYGDLLQKAMSGNLTMEELQAHLPFPSKGVQGDINREGAKDLESIIEKRVKEGNGPKFDEISDELEKKKLAGQPITESDIFKYRTAGEITVPGFNALVKQFAGTPEEKAVSELKKSAYEHVKNQIMPFGGEPLPSQKDAWDNAQQALYFAEQERKGRNIPPEQYFNINDKEYIGNAVKGLVPSPIQQKIDAVQANPQGFPTNRNITDIRSDYLKATDEDTKAQFRKEAEARIIQAINRGDDGPGAMEMYHNLAIELGIVDDSMPKAPVTK